jgi:acetyltransferase-like isoleucine patch superfamily enzyme
MPIESSDTESDRNKYFRYSRLELKWIRFWMRFAGLSPIGRIATRLATFAAHPHKARSRLAYMNPKGYVSPSTVIHHADLHFGAKVFIDDRVVIFQRETGGSITIGDRVCIYRDTIIETGEGGSLTIGTDSSIHPRCQINAYVAPISIGAEVMIGPNCAIYPYDHGFAAEKPIWAQALESKGGVSIGDGAWLGFGVVVLSGVKIGEGSVVGAGSVVTSDVPAATIAMGNPARVVKTRKDINSNSSAAKYSTRVK